MRTPALASALATILFAAGLAVAQEELLLEDRGGFDPTAEQIEAATLLGNPARRTAALVGMEMLPSQERLGILRAGLRLRDAAAARACAALLDWQRIDRWECARCVDLLVDGVLRPGDAADFEEFRSYIGSVEHSRFLRALPPLPWAEDPVYAIATMHRIARAEHIPLYIKLAKHPDPAVAATALADLGLLGRWNDDFREEVEAAFLAANGVSTTDLPPSDGKGLPPALTAGLRLWFLEHPAGDPAGDAWSWDLRWLWECEPGPRDAGLLIEMADHGDAQWTTLAGAAYVLLGRLSDPETEAFLRRRAEDGEVLAVWALARRGDLEMRERLVADARAGEEFALALLMEVDPRRARRLVEETVLGRDDDAAYRMLDDLAGFALPGAYLEPLGFAWRRTSFDGFERMAMEARIPALRLACIGVVVPGCRTRSLGKEAALRLRPGGLLAEGEGPDLDMEIVGAFLETAAPLEFADALRRTRRAGGEDAWMASAWLVRMGDREASAALVAGGEDIGWESFLPLARSGDPAAGRWLEERVRAAVEEGDLSTEDEAAVGALAVFHGLEETAAIAFGGYGGEPVPTAACEAVLAGRPLDGLAAILAARPDEPHEDVGLVRDPRVLAYLHRLRVRRDLGHYWYATAQLAVAGDAEARAEFQGAMHDGRYRIMNEADNFERTLGFDLPATMPFWLEELRSQCCRIVTSGGGDIIETFFGLEDGCFQSPYRTAYRRGKELWDAAEGRFVRSRIADLWVAEPR